MVVAGIILLILSATTQAETGDEIEAKMLSISLGSKMKELQALDDSAQPLAEEKKTIDQKCITYGHYHDLWYTANADQHEYFRRVKRAKMRLNSQCQDTLAQPFCAADRAILAGYDYKKAEDEYGNLAKLKRELDQMREEIMGTLGTEEKPGAVGLLGKNSIAGWEYLEKRKIITEQLLGLQRKINVLKKSYTSLVFPKPVWTF